MDEGNGREREMGNGRREWEREGEMKRKGRNGIIN